MTTKFFRNPQTIPAKKAADFAYLVHNTNNGHPERAFFQNFETFGLGQTNRAENLGGILAISSQTIGTILAQ